MNYQALDQNKCEIRLLTILTKSESTSSLRNSQPCPQPEHLFCEIRHYPLKHCSSLDTDRNDQTFIALSYTWGSPTDKEMIYVDGTPVRIQRNLARALQALRKLDCVQQGRKVWADAICINQADSKERNREVRRMAELYRTANDVVIWLGDSDFGSDEAIDFINNLTAAAKIGSDSAKQFLRTVLSLSHNFTLWESLTGLLSRLYFLRML